MKNLLALLLILFSISSCNIQFSGYMSDDLYYSVPLSNNNQYIDLHDRYLYMKTRGNRWQSFDDDFNYWNIRPGFVVPNYNRWYNIYDPFLSTRIPAYPFFGQNFNYSIINYNQTIYNNRQRTSDFKVFTNPNQNNFQRNEPRKFNLNTFNNSSNLNTNRTNNSTNPNTTTQTRNSAPVRKFDKP